MSLLRKSIILAILFLSGLTSYAQVCTVAAAGNTHATIEKMSWAQSFIPGCSGKIKSILFESGTQLDNDHVKVTLHRGPGSLSPVIGTAEFDGLSYGVNKVTFDNEIIVTEGNTYFFQVLTDKTVWKVIFNPQSQVDGFLSTHVLLPGKSTLPFTEFDWSFSVNTELANEPESSEPKKSDTMDLFILAGQSNALGWYGNGVKYPYSKKDDDIYLNYSMIGETWSNKWIGMQAQKGHFPYGGFGPEVTFARKLKSNGYNPAIFKFTKGATSLCEDWKVPGAGGYYDQMVLALKKSIIELEERGYVVNVRGFIWIQGESDSYTELCAKSYQANLQALIDDLRKRVLIQENLPVLLGVNEYFLENYKDAKMYGHYVSAAQHSIADADTTIKFTPMDNDYIPKCDTCDIAHLTLPGILVQGKQFYASIKDLLKEQTP